MKRKLLYIFFTAVISFTSTGFGFLESSTAMHGRVNHHAKSDSLRISAINISLKNASIPPSEVQKPEHETITKSVIQWMADAVKNTVEKILAFVVRILQSVILDLIKFFAK